MKILAGGSSFHELRCRSNEKLGLTKAVLRTVFTAVTVDVGWRYAEQNCWSRPPIIRTLLSAEQPGGKNVRSSSSARGEDAADAARAKKENAVEDLIVSDAWNEEDRVRIKEGRG